MNKLRWLCAGLLLVAVYALGQNAVRRLQNHYQALLQCSRFAERLAMEIDYRRPQLDALFLQLQGDPAFAMLRLQAPFAQTVAPKVLSRAEAQAFSAMLEALGRTTSEAEKAAMSYYTKWFSDRAQELFLQLSTARSLYPKMALGLGLCAAVLVL